MPDEFDTAWNQYAENMTSEEAQKELLDAFILYVLAARKLNRVAHANVLDSEGKITRGRTMIEKVSAPEVIGKINSILENNPGLLAEWQSVALLGIIGRDVINEKMYVPIMASEFKKHLLLDEIKDTKTL